MDHSLQDTSLIEVEEDNIINERVATEIYINNSSLLEQDKIEKCQIKHGLRFVATWDRLFILISLNERGVVYKTSQYLLMASAV